MDSESVWTIVVAVVLLSAATQVLTATWLRRSLMRELAASAPPANAAADVGVSLARGESVEPGDPARLAEIAPELVSLARAATESAIRTEEVHEWHQLDLFPLGSDDISEAIRDKVRRASFDALATRSALFLAIRRHRGAIPAPLEAELRGFCDRLDPDDGSSRSERKRRLAADLDALEAGLRETIGADLFRVG